MKQFLLLLFTLFSLSISAQIDWDAYEDPGGTFYRLQVRPDIGYSYNDFEFSSSNGHATSFELPTRFFADIVKEKSILNVFSALDFNYDYTKELNANDGESNHFIQQSLRAEYFHYFTERRGFHVQGELSLNNTFNNDQFADINTIGVLFGKGRLENISTVYQGIRIQKQYNASMEDQMAMGQEQLFDLADAMRKLDFNTKLDSRYRSIENQQIFLEKIDELGFNLDDYYNIANMIDAYRFERSSQTVPQGKLVQLGFQRTWLGGNATDEIVLSGSLGQAINENWHFFGTANFEYDIDGEFAAFITSRLTFVPIARTRISLNLSPSYRSFSDNSVSINSFNSLEYFISPQLSLNGGLTAFVNNIGKDFSTNSIGFTFGVNYFII